MVKFRGTLIALLMVNTPLEAPWAKVKLPVVIPFRVELPEAVMERVFPTDETKLVLLPMVRAPVPLASLSALIVRVLAMLVTSAFWVMPLLAERVMAAIWDRAESTVILPPEEVIDKADVPPFPVIYPKRVEVVILSAVCKVRPAAETATVRPPAKVREPDPLASLSALRVRPDVDEILLFTVIFPVADKVLSPVKKISPSTVILPAVEVNDKVTTPGEIVLISLMLKLLAL